MGRSSRIPEGLLDDGEELTRAGQGKRSLGKRMDRDKIEKRPEVGDTGQL